jgi:hypothetical protein
MATRMQQRRGTATQWTTANPILNAGEIGYETNTNKFKIGDGTNHWADLAYFIDEDAVSNYVLDTELGELTQDIVDAALVAGTGVTKTYHDNANTITIAIDSTVTTNSGSQTLSNKSIDFSNNTVTATLSQLNTAISDGDLVSVAALSNTLSDYALVNDVANIYASKDLLANTIEASAGTGLIFNPATDQFDVDSTTVQLRITGVTDTELGYLSNVTSDIQEQINSKAASADIAELSVDAVAQALSAGTHTNISVSYNDGSNSISLTGAVTYTDENAQDAVGNALGNGLSYDDSTGAISVNTSTIQARVADVSDTEIGYLNGVTSGIQSQIDGKISSSSTDTLTNKTINLANNTVSGTLAQFNSAISDDDILPISGGTLTGALTLSGAPTESLHAATKAYVDSAVEGLHVHPSVRVATTTNVALATALENGDVLDGITLVTGDRILVKDQTTKSENGIYVVQASGQPTRATDFDTASEVDSGDFVFVDLGNTYANTGWVQINTPATIGTDAIEFVQFSGAGTYTAGTGLTLDGTVFSIANTVATLSGTQVLTNKTINGADNTLTVRIANDVSGLGSGVATFLGTPSSANLASAVTDETGSGALVFGTSPTIATPRVQMAMNAQTGTTYTLALTDASNRWVTCDNTSAITVTVPPSVFSVGDQIAVQQTNTGQVTFAIGSGVTITSAGATTAAPKIRTRYSSAVVICTGSNTFTIIGDIV